MSNKFRLQMRDDYRVEGPTPPHVMHLDMFFMRCDDAYGRGKITHTLVMIGILILSRFVSGTRRISRSARRDLNVSQLARYLLLPADLIEVTPLGEYAVSAKRHLKYGDLIIYVFEFCSVVLRDPPITFGCKEKSSGKDQSWFYLRIPTKPNADSEGKPNGIPG